MPYHRIGIGEREESKFLDRLFCSDFRVFRGLTLITPRVLNPGGTFASREVGRTKTAVEQTWKMSFSLYHPKFRQNKFTQKSA